MERKKILYGSKRKKLLVLPSWYPCPADRISGSFFQEQAQLVSDHLDVKILLFQFTSRPPLRTFFKTPLMAVFQWWNFVFQKRILVQLPDDEIFSSPPLILFKMRIIGLTVHNRYQQRLGAYLDALEDMIINGWKPDLIHAQSVNMGGLIAQYFKKVYGIPYVITEHMPFSLCNYQKFLHEDIKGAFKNADLVLSLSYDKVRQLGISEIDVEPNLIFNFVDDTVFNKLCEAYQPGHSLKLISIGAASHFKDHRTLLRALSLLKNRGIPFTMTLIGLKAWGDLYNETLGFIKSYGLACEVTVIDRMKRTEVCDSLAAHNIYLMTSIAEGFPVSVLEALACGLFVIATRHGGTEDILACFGETDIAIGQ